MNLGKFCFNSLDIRSLHYTLDIYVSLMKVNVFSAELHIFLPRFPGAHSIVLNWFKHLSVIV